MATIKASSFFSSSSPQRIKKAKTTPTPQKLPIQTKKISSFPSLQVNNYLAKSSNMKEESTYKNNVVQEMYAIMESVADRVEMHKNIGEQRNNWNQLLLTSVNSMITSAATMAALGGIINGGVGTTTLLALKLSSTLIYISATGVLIIMNKIQPSQLAEEQRNASRLFKQIRNELQTKIALKMVDSNDVKDAMEKVLALDKAYPLPLIGVMIDKFPKNVEPATWWPKHHTRSSSAPKVAANGWDENLEDEMKKIIGYIKRKDEEDYLKLAKIALKINKFLAILGPLLTGLAAVGSALTGSTIFGTTWPAFSGVVCGALAMVVNTIEHGGQVGMVFEMYRSSAGFFRFMEENIESELDEDEVDRRENGEVFEAKVALELGRSPSELRDLVAASASSSSSRNLNLKEEFASKLI